MKKIKSLLLIFLMIIFTSCGNDNPQDITDLIVEPEAEEPMIKGTWEVSDIKQTNAVVDLESIKIGDLLYIDKQLVALNNDYAYPPRFTAKYVDLTNYLQSRGIDIKVSNKKNVVIYNASQGQLYSKDFVVLSENEIFFILDNNIIILNRISKDTDKEVISKYKKKSEEERTLTTSGEAVDVDINLYIGVRERVDSYSNSPDYYYYTYSVRIEPNKPARIAKAENIYFPKKEEFWRFKTFKNEETGKYDSFMAYPARLEAEMDKEDNQKKYKFHDKNMDMRFNFINQDYISFDYTTQSDDLPIGKYAMIKTDQVSSNKIMTISDYTGEKNSNKIFKETVYDEVSKNFSQVKEEDIEYDYTNFGIMRNQGLWLFQTSYQVKMDDSLQQKSFPIDLAIRDDFLIDENKSINIDQVKNINSQEKDYFELINNQYIMIQSSDELLFYKVNNGFIEIKPLFTIPLTNPTQIIMFEQGQGNYAEKWEKSFNDNNVIIR